jgi:hypothetical protein
MSADWPSRAMDAKSKTIAVFKLVETAARATART